MYITELAEPRLLVIYPGRFQPFHKGHHAVYAWLTGKFGRDNVYIASSNKTDNLKSPFTFAEKAYFMQLTGVPADRIVQAANPYQIDNILSTGNITVADRANTVVIFAVSQKDMAEDPRFSFATKKDGSAPYFQPLTNIKDTVSMDRHGYIMTVPTFDFTVAGEPMRSGTELRNMYAEADEAQRQAIIADLFGRYSREAEQIMNSKIPAQKAITGLAPVSEDIETVDQEKFQLLNKARVAHPSAASDEEALALYINDKEEHDVDRLDQENDHEEEEIDRVEQIARELRSRLDRLEQEMGISEDAGGTGVVASKKQARDPRYSTSLTKDVRPGQIKKSLKAFNLAEGGVDALAAQQAEHISQDITAIKQRIATEKLPAIYVEALKKKIAQLEQERVNITLGR